MLNTQNIRFLIVFLTVTLLYMSCQIDAHQLTGQWQATHFYEQGQSVTVPLDSVQLQLLPNGRYQFKSTGFYREAGQWRSTGRFLALKDTLTAAVPERMLRVMYQSQDSLKLQMAQGDKEQALFLARVK